MPIFQLQLLPNSWPTLAVGCLAEFLGVLYFVFLSCGSVATTITLADSAVDPESRVILLSLSDLVAIASAVLFTMKYSGAHLNPAVSIGLFFSGRTSLVQALTYIGSQLSGAVLGAGLVKAIIPSDSPTHLGSQEYIPKITAGQAVLGEALFTIALIFVIYASAIDSNKNLSLAPLYIGIVVGADHFFGVRLTGPSMNPARSFGPAVWTDFWGYQWIYWVGPISGSIIGCWMFELLILAKDWADRDLQEIAMREMAGPNPGDELTASSEKAQLRVLSLRSSKDRKEVQAGEMLGGEHVAGHVDS